MSDLIERLRDASLDHNKWKWGWLGEAIDELERLRAELERERMRLVACGVVAMANTQESAATHRKMHPDYWSASVQDVAKAVDREMAERERAKRAEAGLDALGVAIVNAGYTWTPEMRGAYEKATNRKG